MINVAIYLRKSREDVELGENTLDRHEQILLEYCAKNNLNVCKIYKEIVSGDTIENRPQMRQLLDDVTDNLYDGVVCIEVERLSRGNPVDQFEILTVFKESNTKIYTLTKVYDLTKEEIDEEYFEFALFMSRREYKTITRRLHRGRNRATREGYYIGSLLPFGFDKIRDDKGYILVPNDDASIVMEIFEECDNGVPYRTIARNLNDRGIKTYNGAWWDSMAVKRLLSNRNYIGMIHSKKKKEWYEGKHKGFIPSDLFERVQLRLSQKDPKYTAGNTLQNPFSGFTYCKHCGYSIIRHYCHNYCYLKCKRYGCTNKNWTRIDIFEKKFIEELKQELADFDYVYIEEKKDNTAKKLKSLSKELSNKEKQINKACDMLEKGVYSVELFRSRTEKLQKEVVAIKEQMEELENKPIENMEKIPIISKALDHYYELNARDKNRLLKSIVKRIDFENINNYDVELLL